MKRISADREISARIKTEYNIHVYQEERSMAFFDDLGKKISQASQSAVQKTKDITEIAKYNSAISDEEKKIAGLYSEIGKLYVSLYKDAPASEFAALVEGIKASEETIAKYKDQIKDIKGILTCTSCGAEIPTGSAFCSSCGTAAPVVEAPVGPVCSNCGAALTEGSAFCTSCGASVSAPATDPNKCANCGAVLAEDSAFCTSCGAKR